MSNIIKRSTMNTIATPGSSDLSRLIASESWSLVVMRCQSHPMETRFWSNRPGFFEGIKGSDVLPIHQACALRPPVEVIHALHVAHPEGIRMKESAYRRLPIHIACRSGASTDVVRVLLQYYEHGAAIDDSLGRLAIHYACSNSAPDPTMDALLDACPGSARAYDRKGWLPLHVACSVGSSAHVVRRLLQEFPPSIVLQTNKGTTPLKCTDMTSNPNKAEVVEMLTAAKEQYDEHFRIAKDPSSLRLLV